MPFVRVDLAAGKPAGNRKSIGDVVYDAMRATIAVPENDRLQAITEHAVADFIFDPRYLGRFTPGRSKGRAPTPR